MASVDVTLSRKRSPAEYQDLLATIQDECQQLFTLANQLLELAESDAGLLDRQKEPVCLDKVISVSLEIFSGVAEEKGVQLESDRTHSSGHTFHRYQNEA